MNLNYILKRKKIFKKRYFQKKIKLEKLRTGTVGLVSLKKQRFELVYLRFLKKLIRRQHIRRKMLFRRRKYWFFLRPNCFLSGKTTNSRMGAGVGALVRLAINLDAYTSFAEFKYYSAPYLKYLKKALKYKYPLNFKLFVDFEYITNIKPYV